jgi:hypothetical protein
MLINNFLISTNNYQIFDKGVTEAVLEKICIRENWKQINDNMAELNKSPSRWKCFTKE